MYVLPAALDQTDQIVTIAQMAYIQECSCNSSLPSYASSHLDSKIFYDSIKAGHCFVCIDENKIVGYLLFSYIKNDETVTKLYSPVYGCGILPARTDRIKIMSRLFQESAALLSLTSPMHIECKVYSHDRDILTLFVMTEFGIQCSEGIRCTSSLIVKPETDQTKCDKDQIIFRELNKAEIKDNLTHLLCLFQKIVTHLRKSPVFYPGIEFTDEVYTDYILDPATRVFAAFDKGEVIGIIDASPDGNSFITTSKKVSNIGDVYVEKAFRNQKVATQLLSYVNETLKREGIEYLWVEHGTANPNARGFWDKYFEPYCYTLIRNIK